MKETPKIFILGKLPPPYYGPAIATEIILNSRLKEKYTITHINTGLNTSLHSMGKFTWNKPFKIIHKYFSFARKLIKYKPDLVLIPQAQTTSGFIKDSLYIRLAGLLKTKVLLQLRGSNWQNWLNKSNRFLRWYVGKTLLYASGVIVLGNNLKYLFKENFSDDKIFVVPNGADFKFPSKEIETDYASVLYFSNLIPAKGVEDVLEAAKLVKNSNKNKIEFLVVGQWNDAAFERKCKNFIEKNHLNVKLFPATSGKEKLSFFRKADIFVFTPREPEGHPWVIVEALAAGLPIISTDKGAIVESVKNNYNGFIVRPFSPEEIAEKILLLEKDLDLRKTMSKNSINTYTQKFTEEKMIEKLSNAFDKVIYKKSRFPSR